MKNAIIWEFDNFLVRDVIESLDTNNIIKIKRWFVNDKYINDDFFKNKKNIVNWFELIINGDINKNNDIKIEDKIYDNLSKKFNMFIDLLIRHSYFTNQHNYESINVINMFIKYFYFILTKENIEVIIFPDIPHDLPNYMLYCIAKELNIKTIILVPSFFLDKFHYIFNIEEYGVFDNSDVYSIENNKIKLKKKYKKELFYMVKPSIKEIIKKNFRFILNFPEWFNERKDIIIRKKSIYAGLYEWILTKIIKSTKLKLENYLYNNMLKKYSRKIDLNLKYVYFPLHLQPEMTTSVLGGIYSDQVLAIERLAKIIPSDWYIYVKENPKQTSYMRGKFFFRRLKLISKAILVNNNINTYDLIEKSQFVATITGTAGWEAITGGKNVLVFGKAWYGGFPGVFRYDSNIKISDILDFEIDHNKVEETLEKLNKKIAKGVFNSDLLEGIKNFNVEENKIDIYNFFVWMLNKR